MKQMKKSRRSIKGVSKAKRPSLTHDERKIQEELKLLTPKRNWPEPTTFSHRSTSLDFLRKVG